jgi:histidinol-phosphate aminotransferase
MNEARNTKINVPRDPQSANSYAERGNRLIGEINAYTPGMSRAEAAAKLNIDPSSIGKMSSNENPIGPPPLAIKAVKELCDLLHEYPSPSGIELREAIGNFLDVEPDQVVLGTGASALFHSLMVAFTAPGNEVISLSPSFPLYAATARVHDCVPVHVELAGPDFLFDRSLMENAINPRTRLIFLTRPNNPTANLISIKEVMEVSHAAKAVGALLIVDEAYLEYVDNYEDETATQLVRGKEPSDNVIITRTFGKAFGLGNLRIGYAIGTSAAAAQLRNANDKWSTGDINRAAAIAALRDTNHLRLTRMLAHAGREMLARELSAMGFYVVPNSQSINIMVDVSHLSRAGLSAQNAGWSAKEFADEVFRRGHIMIRGDFSKTHVRISIAQPDINERLIRTVRTMVEDQLQ